MSGVRTRWYDDEGGFAGGAETLVIGSLIFLVGTILAINAWAVMDAQFAADGAAREAARFVVEAPNPRTVTDGQVQQVARDAIGVSGYDGTDLVANVNRIERNDRFGDPSIRCATVTVEVDLAVQTIRMPFVDTSGWGSAWTVEASHSEIVDPFRTGLPGEVSCGF